MVSNFSKIALFFWAISASLLIFQNPWRWIVIFLATIIFLYLYREIKLLTIAIVLSAIAIYSFHQFALKDSSLARYANTKVLLKVEGRLAGDPTIIPAKVINGYKLPTRYSVILNLNQFTVRGEIHYLRLPIRLIDYQPIKAEFGEVVAAVGFFSASTEAKVAGILSAKISPDYLDRKSTRLNSSH